MDNPVIGLLILGGIALFLILRLKSVLGTRDGFEAPPANTPTPQGRSVRRDFEVIDGGPDRDIIDHVDDGSESARALAGMKLVEPGFSVTEFIGGARGAYEMILMAFERGDVAEIEDFLAEDVYETFVSVIADREDKGLRIEADFVGVREVGLESATFDRDTNEAEVTLRFVGELTSVVRNEDGEIVEGNPNEIKKQRDVWTFARTMGEDDPNWRLVATGG
ncbi:Tim44/TimA family putative adaptor protein [Thalassobacter stenotrophicus]|uniref:Mitochondrial import inner membrane, translocase subunit n=2 Tax=Thalassobacter stenotrophicus TaxID=266809 RepID=A0A0N7LTF7_9RHOB|nr:Tim44/TimA family putative adaptor protein [Thalassobacter stenotrophicus]PVZ49523.1 Tim44 domain-containing protein [Thalassobacter stenotrophicus]CUH60570.1 mitochondrial import inner membrane, translocase subunit [Thalassobacter stenotrophicus]SHJ24213.1 Predicted lipid-binding transport protein, Tim44 family [Thalassobacter stenotrophicus DSM 16310]